MEKQYWHSIIWRIKTIFCFSMLISQCPHLKCLNPMFDIFYFQHTGACGKHVWNLACQCFRRGLQDNRSEIYRCQTWKWKEVVSSFIIKYSNKMSGLYCVTSCKAKLSLGVWNFLKVKCLHTCHKWLPSFSPASYIHRADFLLTHLTSLYQLQNTRCFPAAKSCFSEPSGLRKQITYLSKIMLSKSCCLLLIY